MEFLLQLIAELFGGETLNESENIHSLQVQSIVELENEPALDKEEKLEEVPSFFGVIQFL